MTAVTSVCSWISAPFARAPFLQRHRQVRRRDVAVVRVIEPADDRRRVRGAAERQERPQFLHLLRPDDLEGHADRVRRAAVLLVLVHAVARGREAEVPGHVEADVLPGLGRQALVEVDRVLVQLPDRVAHVEERKEAGGVPGGTGGQLRALEEHDIRPALVRQVIEGADPDGSAADHDHPRMLLHAPEPPRCAPGQCSRWAAAFGPECDLLMSETDIQAAAAGILEWPWRRPASRS